MIHRFNCRIIVVALGFFAFSDVSHGYSLSASAEAGKGYAGRSLDFSHDLIHEDDGIALSSWGVSYSGDKTTDESTRQSVTSSQFRGDIAAAFGSSLTGAFGLKSTTTPDVKFSNRGATVRLEYFHEFNGEADEEDELEDAFAPALAVGLTFGRSDIQQEVEFTILSFLVRRTFELKQAATTVDVSWDALDWLSLSVEATGYSYDEETSRLSAATQSRFLNTRTSDMVNTIYGLPKSESSLSLTFRPGDDWQLSLGFDAATSLIDELQTRTTSLDARWRVDRHWKVEFGVARAASESSNWESASFGIGYSF